jgi:hypothetical protein
MVVLDCQYESNTVTYKLAFQLIASGFCRLVGSGPADQQRDGRHRHVLLLEAAGLATSSCCLFCVLFRVWLLASIPTKYFFYFGLVGYCCGYFSLSFTSLKVVPLHGRTSKEVVQLVGSTKFITF